MCQSSVRSLPRQFGELEKHVKPLGFSEVERKLSKFDGGSELDLLKSIPESELTDTQREVLESQESGDWCRPCLPVRGVSGNRLTADSSANTQRTSVYDKRITDFAVGQSPDYRRHGTMKRDGNGSLMFIKGEGNTESNGLTDGSDLPVPAILMHDEVKGDGNTESNGLTDGSALPVPSILMHDEVETQATSTDDCSGTWENFFATDVRNLAQEIFVHICGDSCHKYSDAKKVQICRHGFYYIVNLGTWEQRGEGIAFRRRGKALRNSVFIVKNTKHGMQGRLCLLQEHPFEVQTNYAGAAALRCNFDVQDLRRVLPEHLWKQESTMTPGVGMDAERASEFGYMGTYEWDGEAFVPRETQSSNESGNKPAQWHDEQTHAQWRDTFLEALEVGLHDSEPCIADCECLKCECIRASIAAFGDAINTGFYVNSYTTKQCPTMEGVLENLRQGLERLEDQRLLEKLTLAGDSLELESSLGRKLTKQEMKPYKGKSAFAETLRTLNRMSASYRRCQWKSGAEMIFPILYGHLTFTSHRCWTVYTKKAIFLAAESWRSMYGQSIRHAAIKAGGGEILQHLRQGMDPYPLPGWRWIDCEGLRLLEGPHGERCPTSAEAFDIVAATCNAGSSQKDVRQHLTMIQKFLNECCSETITRAVVDDQDTDLTAAHSIAPDDPPETVVRHAVTTSPLEDWLWRGDHPILVDMPWYVYSMWVFRIEKFPAKSNADGDTTQPGPRFIDIQFSCDYKMHHTHKQRVATEFRVPLYEGFTMPPSTRDSETAAMYKSLLLRAFSVVEDERPEDVRLADAFRALCTVSGEVCDPNHAFTTAWLSHVKEQKVWAAEAARRFLDRYEFKSLWETEEVQQELRRMWSETEVSTEHDESRDGLSANGLSHGPPPITLQDPDAQKPRASVRQYSALIGQEVMTHLEGLARARVEKHARPYQTDAEIHQSYITATSGGGLTDADGHLTEEGPTAAPQTTLEVFPVLRYSFDQDEMRAILDFEHRKRLSSLAKDLLQFPFMDAMTNMNLPVALQAKRKAEGILWRQSYHGLVDAPVQEKLSLKSKQEDLMQITAEEDVVELEPQQQRQRIRKKTRAVPTSSFAADKLFSTPSGFIRHLVENLAADQKLTREQTLFIAKFAEACDQTWEDQHKPPEEQRTHAILLLGAGGSGKTHVIQKLVFDAVLYIWPTESSDSPSIIVTASSNAQAKNISTALVKARTMHNAAAMRVQLMVNSKMRPGDKLKTLERLWKNVKVLVIEEVSMVSAANYNMLDFRAMYGRQKTHNVNESNYQRRGHSFGRCPITIHLGDFLQLPPTRAMSLVSDVNAKNPDGSYIFTKTPDLEIQHAIKVFTGIQHSPCFELTHIFTVLIYVSNYVVYKTIGCMAEAM